jgi:hypothetical protein
MAEIYYVGEVVQVTDSPGLLDRKADFMRYLGQIGVIVEIGINAECWIVQFDDGVEVEVPATCLVRE